MPSRMYDLRVGDYSGRWMRVVLEWKWRDEVAEREAVEAVQCERRANPSLRLNGESEYRRGLG